MITARQALAGCKACFKQFIGFEEVIADWKSGGDTVKQTETRFHDTEGQPKIDQKKGKILDSWVKNGSGVTLTHTHTDYGVYEGPPEDPWPEGVQFVYPSQVIEKTYCGQSFVCQSKKTKYYYNQKWQNCGGNGPQYGNLTHVEEYDSESAPSPYRTRLTGYCPNATAKIVDKPAFENLYSGDIDPESSNNPNPNQLLSSTWYIYGDDPDNPTWNQTAGSKGELRGVRRVAQVSPSLLLADTRYWYDTFGNVITETVYNSQDWVEYGDYDTWASANPQSTRTEYDLQGVFLAVTNPLTPRRHGLLWGQRRADGPGRRWVPGPGQVGHRRQRFDYRISLRRFWANGQDSRAR